MMLPGFYAISRAIKRLTTRIRALLSNGSEGSHRSDVRPERGPDALVELHLLHILRKAGGDGGERLSWLCLAILSGVLEEELEGM
jgi:hypothetical protein